MKVKDFIEIIRPITMCNPEMDIHFTQLDSDHSSSVLIEENNVFLALKSE